MGGAWKTGLDFPLIYRLSADEDVPNGVTLEEACTFAKWAEEAGADAIHVTAGTWDSRMEKYFDVMSGKESPEGKKLSFGVATSMWVPPNYTPRGSLVYLAEEVKKKVSVPVIAVCSITPEMGEVILERGGADFISIGRQILADPDYPEKVIEGRPETIRRCLRCNECLGEVMKGRGISCAVNAEAGKEYERFTDVVPAGDKKKVAVVGAGPGGMQAAIIATLRGHDVTLFEKDARLGGQLYYVSIPDFKQDYRDYTQYIIRATESCGAKIKTGVEVTVDIIKNGGFDVVIVATGASTFKPGIAGAKDEAIFDPLEVLDGKIPEGREILVCGAGLVGCEVAMFLSERCKTVTMIDMLPMVAPDMPIYTKWVLDSKLAELGIKIKLNHKIIEMSGKHVKCKTDNQEVDYQADAVISALGLKSKRRLLDELRKECKDIEIIPVGDINEPRKIIQAVHEGFHAGRRI